VGVSRINQGGGAQSLADQVFGRGRRRIGLLQQARHLGRFVAERDEGTERLGLRRCGARDVRPGRAFRFEDRARQRFESIAHLDDQSFGRLAADAGYPGQRGGVVRFDAAVEVVHADTRQDAERDTRPDTGHLDEFAKQAALAFGAEAKQDVRVFADDEVRVQVDFGAHGGQPVKRSTSALRVRNRRRRRRRAVAADVSRQDARAGVRSRLALQFRSRGGNGVSRCPRIRVAQGKTDRVGSVRSQLALQLEHRSNHQLHLLLLRSTLTYDREFDLPRCVLEHLGAHRKDRADRSSPCLAELQGAVGVAMHEDPLDGNFARFVLPHEFEHALEDLPQARRKIRATRADRTARHVTDVALPPVDDAEARVLRAGVDAEDADRLSATGAGPECPAFSAPVESRQFPPCSEPGNRASYDTVFPPYPAWSRKPSRPSCTTLKPAEIDLHSLSPKIRAALVAVSDLGPA
jgi:hypothetical protein